MLLSSRLLLPLKRAVVCFAAVCATARIDAEVPDVGRLTMSQWAEDGMTVDPVAIAFDRFGRLYVAESARRGSVDIDIRAHRAWLLEDLASDDFASMRAFFRRKMASKLSEENSQWLLDRNGDGVHDYRDLMTVSERIRVLEDTDGDGMADKSTLYADGFNEEFTGVAAGVLPFREDVFFTVYPDLWRLRDLDGDQQADQRESLFRGFGVHAAFDGHDLHGLTVGPEGKIYFSCGDNGFSVVTQEGRRLHYPHTGGILRMNPDGSHLEVFAYGLRNVQEFDFDQYGNMFGVDNDGDLEDERERAVYIAEGSDSGWRLNWQFRSQGWQAFNGGMTYNPWTSEGMWLPQHSHQPAYITPPMHNYSVGPGGFKFNPGTALNEQYRDFFFCVQFPVKQITAFRTKPRGAGFEMVDDHLFNAGLMVSSLNFGPDGGCYLADWIGKWQPNQQGIIYRVDDPSAQGSDLRREVQSVLNRGVTAYGVPKLLSLLGHADRRVRQQAQFELVRRYRGDDLLQVANSGAPQLARLHALWGLIQLNDPALAPELVRRLPWRDSDRQVRQQCARVAGDLRLANAELELIRLLMDDEPLVRSHAAIALGKVGTSAAVVPLFDLLRRNADLDPFIRHAAVLGLAGSATGVQLANRAGSDSAAERLGAVLALRRQASSEIVAFLDDEHVRVLREAVRAVHDDFSIPDSLPAVASLLDDPDLPIDEPTLRRVLSANLRVGDRASADRLVAFLKLQRDLGELTSDLQLEALHCLESWEQMPLVDRVEGRVRTSTRQDPAAGQRALASNIGSILSDAGAELAAAVLSYARRADLVIDPLLFRQWVRDRNTSTTTRVEALRSLHQQSDSQLDAVLHAVLSGEVATRGDAVWRAAFEILVERHPHRALQEMDWESSLPLRQFFIAQLPRFENAEADEILSQLAAEHAEDTALLPTTLEVLYAARSRGDAIEAQGLEERVMAQQYGEFAFALSGGDAQRGEVIYRSHVSAQCVRCHEAGGKGKQAGPILDPKQAKLD